MSTVKNYLSLIKFSHTIFAMPFAIIGFCLGAADYFSFAYVGSNTELDISEVNWLLRIFLLVLVCMISARSAAMAFNRYLDRHFDAKNPRTAIREIPAGIIAPGHALRFVLIACIVFVATTYFLNRLCFFLSPVALFVILFYSYTKRFTPLCHLVLGLGLSLAPIGAYLAVVGQFAWLPIVFALVVLFWVSGFDIIFALQDEQFDRGQGLHSIPAWLGIRRALLISRLLHLMSAGLVIYAGFYGEFGWLYAIGALGFVGMLVYQQSLVRHGDLIKVNLAFMTANVIASVVFAAFVVAELALAFTYL